MFIGDGAKLVRDAFALAKEKIEAEGRKGAIIFIDEIDAIGTKRFDSGMYIFIHADAYRRLIYMKINTYRSKWRQRGTENYVGVA
jgi:hypothetical protein